MVSKNKNKKQGQEISALDLIKEIRKLQEKILDLEYDVQALRSRLDHIQFLSPSK